MLPELEEKKVRLQLKKEKARPIPSSEIALHSKLYLQKKKELVNQLEKSRIEETRKIHGSTPKFYRNPVLKDVKLRDKLAKEAHVNRSVEVKG